MADQGPPGGGREECGVFQRLKEAGCLECREWLEIRAATPPREQGGLDKSLGEKNRQVGGTRVNHVVKVRKPDPWIPQGGKKIKKTTFSPRSRRTCWTVGEGFRDPTSLLFTPLPSGTGLSQPCLGVCACV